MPVTARQAALTALTNYRRRGARPDMTIANIEDIDGRDRALAGNIVNGVLQNAIFLDYYIGVFAARSPRRLEPEVLDILRISAYQLIFLTRVPAHAAIFDGVELAKRRAPRAAGLVNAVLRRVAENRDTLPDIKASNELERLSIRWSHPVWLVSELAETYGLEDAVRILEADNREPSITAQVNTLRTDRETLRSELEGLGVSVEAPINFESLRLIGTGALEQLEPFQEGKFYVQDDAAHLAVTAAGALPDMRVADLCAAPGGKSFAMAIAMENRGEIRAFDIHPNKLRLVTRGAERLGLKLISARAGDACERLEELVNWADLVFCDVPCSGLGVIRKKPEIRYKKPEELAGLPEIQLRILRNASAYVKAGGALLYSTCTLRRCENEGVTELFLSENRDFVPEPFELPQPYGRCGGSVTILPHIGDTDGFYICKMRRLK